MWVFLAARSRRRSLSFSGFSGMRFKIPKASFLSVAAHTFVKQERGRGEGMKFDNENYADTFYKGVKYLPLRTS
jgi:hypothetical protein